MKVIIVGLHDSGKKDIRKTLTEYGFKACPKFSGDPEAYDKYYDNKTIKEIFDNNAYLYIDTLAGAPDIFIGALTSDWDNCEFITMSPRELMNITPLTQQQMGEVTIIWMDSNRSTRFAYWNAEDGESDFNLLEEFERQGMQNFTEFIYNFPNSHILYFNNEEPSRVAAIAAAILKYNNLIPIFENSFK